MQEREVAIKRCLLNQNPWKLSLKKVIRNSVEGFQLAGLLKKLFHTYFCMYLAFISSGCITWLLPKKLMQEWAKSRDSRGSNSWVILAGQAHRSFLLLILAGESLGANLWGKFVDHNSWVILGGQTRGQTRRSNLWVRFCWSFEAPLN